MEGPCEFCGTAGLKIAGPEDGLAQDAFCCKRCLSLLRSPATGLPLIRGHSSLELRGVVPEKEASRMINALMGVLADVRPRN